MKIIPLLELIKIEIIYSKFIKLQIKTKVISAVNKNNNIQAQKIKHCAFVKKSS